MLANNDWRIDSRVVREAEALARHGYEVTVVFRRESAAESVEENNGVRYICVPRRRWSPWEIFPLITVHLRILAADARAITRFPLRRSAAVSLLQLAAFPLAAVLGLAFAPLALAIFAFRKKLPRVRRAVMYITQPLLYLNEYAVRCGPIVKSIDPQIVHAHDLITVSCAFLVARSNKRTCFLYDAHELESRANYWTLNRWTNYWVRRYEEVFARIARRVITVCDSIADWLAREYKISRPVVVLNVPTVLGERSAASDVRRQTVRSKLGLPAAVPLAVYVGAVTIDRGLELCVRAVALVPGLHFAFLGPRYAGTERSITLLALELGVQERTHLVDPVASAEVPGFIKDADCSVIAVQNVCLSYYFALPNKLFESAIGGVPIAAGRLVEIRRFVEENGVGVIMDETDPKDIARAIQEILSNRAKYQPTPEKLKGIADRYGWPVQEQRLIELYAGLPC
jgi:glycosyltransferase involved in cell wall biosynthesis